MALTPRDAYLRRTYGFTEDQYEELAARQEGRCAICDNRPPAGKNLHVDHDHKTGLVRGLLCLRCNHDLLGRRDQNPGLFMKAYEYLLAPPARLVLGEHVVPSRPKRNKRRAPTVTRRR